MALLGMDHIRLDAPALGRLLVLFLLALLVNFFVNLYRVRTLFRNTIKHHDIPTLPHSFWFGHLIPMGKAFAKFPSDYTKISIAYVILQTYPELMNKGLIYLDPWPFGEPLLAVFHPDMMAQFTQDKSLPKDALVRYELAPMTGNKDLVSMDGQEWKRWRSIFNPGFSAKNITALVPGFLEEIQVLKERLVAAAESGQAIVMEETVRTATVDVICRAALGIRMHSQTQSAHFVNLLQNQIWWLVCDKSLANTIKDWFPLRPFIVWNNNRRMRNILAPIVEDAWNKSNHSSSSEPKTINTLAIEAYKAEVQQQSPGKVPKTIDPSMLDILIAQLKIFIFAGHDTTASTLSFIYSRIYRAPHILAKVRAEHDAVLGTNPADALARLTAAPGLLQQLPYTSAVIKETLRLYPPGGTLRVSISSGGDHQQLPMLTNPDTGKTYPTAGFSLLPASFMSQRHPDWWSQPEEFLPERWLVRDDDDDHHHEGDSQQHHHYVRRKNAWRPFELGPRNCIGQELAQVELRAILAMTVRELDIEPAYAPGATKVMGEAAYPCMGVGDITGHIKDGFPARIKLRNVEVKAAA